MMRRVNREGGEAEEEVPALSEDAVAAWRRFEEEDEAVGKVEDRSGGEYEGEGVRRDDRRCLGEEGADGMRDGFWGQPEPVAADEYER